LEIIDMMILILGIVSAIVLIFLYLIVVRLTEISMNLYQLGDIRQKLNELDFKDLSAIRFKVDEIERKMLEKSSSYDDD
jgi:hypothetical protein